MFYASDLITQYLPWYYAVQQSLHQVRLPYLLLAEGETGVLSPINALILFLFSFPYAVTLFMLLNLVLYYLFFLGLDSLLFNSYLLSSFTSSPTAVPGTRWSVSLIPCRRHI